MSKKKAFASTEDAANAQHVAYRAETQPNKGIFLMFHKRRFAVSISPEFREPFLQIMAGEDDIQVPGMAIQRANAFGVDALDYILLFGDAVISLSKRELRELRSYIKYRFLMN